MSSDFAVAQRPTCARCVHVVGVTGSLAVRWLSALWLAVNALLRSDVEMEPHRVCRMSAQASPGSDRARWAGRGIRIQGRRRHLHSGQLRPFGGAVRGAAAVNTALALRVLSAAGARGCPVHHGVGGVAAVEGAQVIGLALPGASPERMISRLVGDSSMCFAWPLWSITSGFGRELPRASQSKLMRSRSTTCGRLWI